MRYGIKRIIYDKAKFGFTLAIILGLLENSSLCSEFDPNSPINWTALIQTTNGAKNFEGRQVINLVNQGFAFEDPKVKCDFKFEKGFSHESKIRGIKLGGEYNEKIWIKCSVNGISIETDAIGCTKSSLNFNDMDSGGLHFGDGRASINFYCGVKNPNQ